jgi:hypothetical protein
VLLVQAAVDGLNHKNSINQAQSTSSLTYFLVAEKLQDVTEFVAACSMLLILHRCRLPAGHQSSQPRAASFSVDLLSQHAASKMSLLNTYKCDTGSDFVWFARLQAQASADTMLCIWRGAGCDPGWYLTTVNSVRQCVECEENYFCQGGTESESKFDNPGDPGKRPCPVVNVGPTGAEAVSMVTRSKGSSNIYACGKFYYLAELPREHHSLVCICSHAVTGECVLITRLHLNVPVCAGAVATVAAGGAVTWECPGNLDCVCIEQGLQSSSHANTSNTKSVMPHYHVGYAVPYVVKCLQTCSRPACHLSSCSQPARLLLHQANRNCGPIHRPMP